MSQTLRVGIAGLGTVGIGVLKVLRDHEQQLTERACRPIKVTAVSARDKARDRGVDLSRLTWHGDARQLAVDDNVDVVIELIGGADGIAKELVDAAVKAGKHVVTANKALIAHHGTGLARSAEAKGVALAYEAAVAGGIPIIKALREGLAANCVDRVYGILNGTCNFILTKMGEGMDFEAALKIAQQEGYAEADPSLDVDGHDAAHKVGILASLAHGFWVKPEKVYTEGIRHVAPLDLEFASKLGYTIKLLGIIKTSKTGPVQVTMFPSLIPNDHVLANVSDVYNGILVRGDVVGDTLYYGQGAGQDATASAVLSDIGDAILDLAHGATERIKAFNSHEANGEVRPIDDVTSCYYLRLNVIDRLGVLAKVSTILAKNKIGISSVIQPEGHEGKSVPLILMLHYARNGAMTRALKAINKLASVKANSVMIRVENFE